MRHLGPADASVLRLVETSDQFVTEIAVDQLGKRARVRVNDNAMAGAPQAVLFLSKEDAATLGKQLLAIALSLDAQDDTV